MSAMCLYLQSLLSPGSTPLLPHPQDGYNSIHGWLAMVVCVLGIIFNLANILVLTHRDMKNPVNMILTGIAVADCLVMTEYIPFTIHMWRLADESIPSEETVGIEHHTIVIFNPALLCLWHLLGVPYQLHRDDPPVFHLPDAHPRHLEVHHDQIPQPGG